MGEGREEVNPCKGRRERGREGRRRERERERREQKTEGDTEKERGGREWRRLIFA